MKKIIFTTIILMALSCTKNQSIETNLKGSWRLISSHYIKPDTTISNISEGQEMIKFMNDSHFGCFLHDIKDTTKSKPTFVACGGRYSFKDGKYIEHVDYCSFRPMEGFDVEFTPTINGDTLTLDGIEKLKEMGFGNENLRIVEKYVRIKSTTK